MKQKTETSRDLWKAVLSKLAYRLNEALDSGWFWSAACVTCSPDRCAMRVVDGSLVILIGSNQSVNRVGARLGFDPISNNKPE
jgi:hypothetical protein